MMELYLALSCSLSSSYKYERHKIEHSTFSFIIYNISYAIRELICVWETKGFDDIIHYYLRYDLVLQLIVFLFQVTLFFC